jgi:hypothetical protein
MNSTSNTPRGPGYFYRVVTHNGHGVYSEWPTLAAAKLAAERTAKNGHGPYEIERVEYLAGGARRYWLRQRSRWVPWVAGSSIEKRRPAWVYP